MVETHCCILLLLFYKRYINGFFMLTYPNACTPEHLGEIGAA